ncbi:hypothetical protein AAZX31_U009900 [Glycine max]
MYIKYGPKYIMKHSQQNKLSNETKTPHTYSQNNSKAPKFLKDMVSFKTRKGKQGSKGLSKELIQGKSIWLEAYKNKIASIISKYACELGSINKNQAKAIVQAINGAKHTK